MAHTAIQASDLTFFSALCAAGSLTVAAREMKVTTAAVSRRLAQIETRAGVALLTRTTRRMSPTAEGETVLTHAREILAKLDDLARALQSRAAVPSGLLRVNATLGFGRSHIGPMIARFVKLYPRVDVQLQLSVDPPALSDDAYDVCIRFGPPPEARVIARRMADNRRLLCAAPAYLARHGEPRTPQALMQHNFISIRQGEDAYGIVKLSKVGDKRAPDKIVTVKARGNLTTNDGEVAVNWTLAGLGILQRAQWDVRKYLESGRLKEILSDYETPDASIYAVYPPQHATAARVGAFVDFVEKSLHDAA